MNGTQKTLLADAGLGIAGFALLVVLLFGLFVWPTMWEYHRLGSRPVRVHRITGEAQALGPNGWIVREPPRPTPKWQQAPVVQPAEQPKSRFGGIPVNVPDGYVVDQPE